MDNSTSFGVTSKPAGKETSMQEWLNGCVAELTAQYGVPGAVVAIQSGGKVIEAATGVLSTRTGIPTTADSVFQIGSITKVWTATLAMQLVDEGLLELDLPVRHYLPEFRVADETASRRITTRQLLAHTAGFDGDLFHDTGRGNGAIGRYLTKITDAAQYQPAGAGFAYNNSGYVVAGRIIEVLRGLPFHDVLRQYLIDPLGLKNVATIPEEALLFGSAVGHTVVGADGVAEVAPVWNLPASCAPAGTLLAMSARDLIGFANLHLGSGSAEADQILSPSAIGLMQTEQVSIPFTGAYLPAHWGLGWMLHDWLGGRVIGHDGGTIGQSSFLRMIPGTDIVIVIFANGGNPWPLYLEVVSKVLAQHSEIQLPADPVTRENVAIDSDYITGLYASAMMHVEIVDDGRLTATIRFLNDAGELVEPEDVVELEALSPRSFVVASGELMPMPGFGFMGETSDGKAEFLHMGRLFPRAESTPTGVQ